MVRIAAGMSQNLYALLASRFAGAGGCSGQPRERLLDRAGRVVERADVDDFVGGLGLLQPWRCTGQLLAP